MGMGQGTGGKAVIACLLLWPLAWPACSQREWTAQEDQQLRLLAEQHNAREVRPTLLLCAPRCLPALSARALAAAATAGRRSGWLVPLLACRVTSACP